MPEDIDHPTRSFRFCPNCGRQNGTTPSIKHFVCPDCEYHFYTNAAAAVAAFVVNEKGEFLFVRRAREPAKGKWNVPGGFVNPQESIEEALRREVREEVGIEITRTELLATFPNIYVYRGVTYHTIDLFFLCGAQSEVLTLAPEEIAQVQWLHPETMDMEEIAFPSTVRALQAYLSR